MVDFHAKLYHPIYNPNDRYGSYPRYSRIHILSQLQFKEKELQDTMRELRCVKERIERKENELLHHSPSSASASSVNDGFRVPAPHRGRSRLRRAGSGAFPNEQTFSAFANKKSFNHSYSTLKKGNSNITADKAARSPAELSTETLSTGAGAKPEELAPSRLSIQRKWSAVDDLVVLVIFQHNQLIEGIANKRS